MLSEVIDMIPVGNTELSVVAEDLFPIDLLNRQGVIDQIIQLLNIVSEKHTACTFALNGTWGTGKTFVLNKLMQQLLDYQDGEKFFVFHYNCWQYDYYEEPLIAIVAALLDSVDQENHVFSGTLRENAKKGMEIAKPVLEHIATEFLKQKIGISLSDILSILKSSTDALDHLEEQMKEDHQFDEYYSFKKAMRSAQEGIRSLSQNRTVVVIVDELDRCLPNYAIRVLERLHHLFSELTNSAVILAVDKTQLDKTVQQIFGGNTDTTKYLKKFIDFEVQLDIGRIESGFSEKYADYLAFFDDTLIETEFSFETFISALFANIDIRTQERLMERVQTIHTILFPNVKKDYSFMCFELLWTVFSEVHNLTSKMPIVYNTEKRCFSMQHNSVPLFAAYLEEEWSHIYIKTTHEAISGNTWYTLSIPTDIPHLLIWYLNQMYEKPSVQYRIEYPYYSNGMHTQNMDDLKKFDQLLRIIK